MAGGFRRTDRAARERAEEVLAPAASRSATSSGRPRSTTNGTLRSPSVAAASAPGAMTPLSGRPNMRAGDVEQVSTHRSRLISPATTQSKLASSKGSRCVTSPRA